MLTNKKIFFAVVMSILFLILNCLLSCSKDLIETEESQVDTVEEVTEELEGEGETLVEEVEVKAPIEESEEVEETVEVAEEDSIQKKLDEIQEKYSLEFRLYLESMEKNCLENILSDDNAIKQEYDLFEWRNIFYRDEIIFTADGDIFPSEWYGTDIDAKAENLSEDEIERSKRIIISALDKYPIQFLKYNLKSVYVLKSMSFFGVNYGGTNSVDCVYVANDGEDMGYTDIIIEQEFHHEFSSILFFKYGYIFNESGWRQVNPAGFEYFDEVTGGAGAIKEGRASQEFDPKAHEAGFLYEYAQSTVENDFNSFAENIFMGNENFFETVERYEKLKMKLGLIV